MTKNCALAVSAAVLLAAVSQSASAQGVTGHKLSDDLLTRPVAEPPYTSDDTFMAVRDGKMHQVHGDKLSSPNFDPVRDHNAFGDGVTDDAAAINASGSDCAAAGGGTIVLRSKQFLFSSADITVPIGCNLRFLSIPRVATSGATVLTQPALIRPDNRTVRLYGGLENAVIIEQGLNVAPTSTQDVYNKVTGMTGTAVTLMSHDAQIMRSMIIGGATCIDNNSMARVRIDDLWVHCLNVLPLNGVHDDSYIRNVHGWPLYPGISPYYFDQQVISAVASVGGLYRLTVPTTANLATGNRVMIYGAGGTVGVNGKKTITVVDATHIDIQGSVPTGVTANGTWASGETLVFLGTLPEGIWSGSIVSGSSNIPVGTTVQSIDFNKKAVRLSAAATGAGSSVALTFADPTAYTSGGKVEFHPSIEPLQTFISYTSSEESKFTNLFEFGWKKGYSVGTGAVWPEFSMASCDSWKDSERVCIETTGNPVGASFIGGQGGGTTPFLNDNGTAGATNIMGWNIRNDTERWVQISLSGSGELQLAGNFSTCSICSGGASPGEIVLYSGAGRKSIQGGNMPNLDIFPQNWPTARDDLVVGEGTIFADGSPFGFKQGSWTPALAFGGNGAGFSYSFQTGTYTAHWPYIDRSFYLSLNGALPAQTGVATLTGAPTNYTCLSVPTTSATDILDSNNMTGLTGTTFMQQVDNSATLSLFEGAPTGKTALTNAAFTTSSVLRGNARCRIWMQR